MERVILACDKCGTESPADQVERVSLAVDGTAYVGDLCKQDMEPLNAILAACRKTGAARAAKSPHPQARRWAGKPVGYNGMMPEERTLVRNWARENGVDPCDKAYISTATILAYDVMFPGTLRRAGGVDDA